MGTALTSTLMKSAPRSWTLCRLPRERVMTMAVTAASLGSGLSSGVGATGLLATRPRGGLRWGARGIALATTLLPKRAVSLQRQLGCRRLRSVRRLRLLRQLASSLAWGTESGHAVASLVVTFVADALVE